MSNTLVFVIFLIFSLTIINWIYASKIATCEEFNKKNAQLILGLIFWPIWWVVLIVMGFWKLFKTAFGKEKN
jgi:ribose/xylose/arabinose/galactoside ABC-type transport system permease subunit